MLNYIIIETIKTILNSNSRLILENPLTTKEFSEYMLLLNAKKEDPIPPKLEEKLNEYIFRMDEYKTNVSLNQ